MNSDESPRNMQYSSNRKPLPPKNQVYSPSSNYNYGNQSQHGSNHGSHANQGGYGSQQRRKPPMPFKRDHVPGGGASDKLAKQNDIIIRLLKEIRDRLPPPPVSAITAETSETDVPDEAGLEQETSVGEVAVGEAVAEQDHDEPGPPPPAAVPPRSIYDDEDLDEQANGNR